jgi:hypothetical protein
MAEEKCEKDATCDTCNQSSSCDQQKELMLKVEINSPISNIGSW